MALSILNNIASLAAQNNLSITGSGLQKTLFRLSSGSRINTGADDAAGLAIADGLHANVTALTQSSRNANDGVGKLQVADGALAQVTTLLNRAVTLATEAATGTVSQAQRGALDAEFTAIKAEIDRIGTNTTFNGTAVFQSATRPNLNELDNPAAAGTLTANDVLTVGQKTTLTSGATTFTYTAAATSGVNPNEQTSAGAALTAASVLVASKTLTLTRGGVTTTFATGAGNTATVGDLITAINAGVTTVGTGGAGTGTITVAGTDTHTGYKATLVGGQIQIVDTRGTGNLAVTGFDTINAGTTGFAATTATSTVQDLINAINADSTVGLKAVLSGGTVKLTDPLARGSVTAATTDTVLGAAVAGASTSFANPTIQGTAADHNTLVGNTGSLTAATAIANGLVVSFSAGGKTFTYTAAGGTGTVGELLAAINNPSDPAGLQAYIGAAGTTNAGKFVIVDPGNHGDLAVNGTTTAVTFGTLSNPIANGTPTTDIFLSDSTTGGASTIAVAVPGLGSAILNHGASSITIASDSLQGTDDAAGIANAKKALTDVNQAVANVAGIRGDLGAGINRLQSAVNVINNQTQNLTAAEDGIRSADIAQEVANLTKFSILNQTGISALAQANQTQQQVLALLR
jgi:flagellin